MSLSRGLVSSFVALSFIGVFAGTAYAAVNLIQNPSFTTASGSNPNIPANWSVGGFDSTFTGAYPVAGPSDATAARIAISAIAGGDAKWVPDQVTAEAGAEYTFSDAYNSNVTSYVIAAYSHTNGTQTFEQLGYDIPSTTNTWQTVTRTFTVPQGVTSMTIYHAIKSVGQITVDNYSLELVHDAASNIFPQGIVTLTFDDGWISQYVNAFPVLQANNLKGTFFVVSNYIVDSSRNLFTDAGVIGSMTVASNTSGTTWGSLFIDNTTRKYFFSDTYTSANPSTLSVTYTIASVPTTVTKSIPAGSNAQANINIDFPATIDAGSLTIAHAVSTGTITISNPALFPLVNGYMSAQQVKNMQDAGNEIGVHTRDHCSIVRLDINPLDTAGCARVPSGPTSMADQVNGALATILANVAAPVDTFAYPYGEFSLNTETFLANNGFVGARTTVPGYNTKNSDPYALYVQTVDPTTTAAKMKSWIDYALANKLWLIILFHQVDTVLPVAGPDEGGGTTPTIFSEVMSYLATQPAGTVKTMHEVLAPGVIVPDTTAPVIAAHAQVNAATSSATGTNVTYTLPTATDDRDGAVAVNCLPASGSVFAVGTTTITCSAQDAANNTATSNFEVVVTLITVPADTTAPVIAAHAPVTAATSSASGTTVSYTAPTATDNVDGAIPVTCVPASGANFPIGTTTVTCSAQDAANNVATSTFDVVVSLITGAADTNAPVIGSHGEVTVTTTSSSGSIVSYELPTASDNMDPIVTVSCAPASGTNFSVGTTIVTCNASDVAGNTATATNFNVVVILSASNSGGGGGGGTGSNIIIGGNGPIVGTFGGTNISGSVLGAFTTASSTSEIKFIFERNFGYRSRIVDVTELQKILISLKLLNIAEPTGFFGSLTRTAVKQYQAAHAITTTGYVGPLTRGALNK